MLASAGMDSLAVMFLSACSKPGGPCSLILGGDSFIGSVGHSEPVGFFHQYEENVLKVSRGPCDGAAIRPFGHHPDALSAFHPQWFCLIGRCGLVLCLSSD